MKITTQSVLEKASSYEILDHYLKPFHNYILKLKQGQNISNPFLLPQKQKTPSFNIYKSQTTNEWRYKDFATDDEGSCFDLVMKLFNLNLTSALQRINDDFNLGLQIETKIISNSNKQNEIKKEDFSFISHALNPSELKYWSKYGITTEHLQLFNVIALESYSSINKDGKPYTHKYSNEKPIFAYVEDKWIKIYKPSDKNFRFQYLGKKQANFVFGLKQLPEKGELIVITGGEKDVMTMFAHGFSAIAFNSETAQIPKELIIELKNRFKNILILYDNDTTGLKQSEKLSRANNIARIILTDLKEGKDVSDFFLKGNTTKDLQAIFDNAISKIETNKEILQEKIVINSIELMAMKTNPQRYLMEPILPSSGTVVLAGQPDTGKSQFARQLCIQIATGMDKFLDFPLILKNKRALYISTEDDMQNTHFLLYRQLNGLKKDASENLNFIFADTLTQDEIINEVEKFLTSFPCDLVVVDSYGDIFVGSDTNNSTAMRQTVKNFDRLAKKFDCLILFIHHINKSAYGQTPAQQHVMGGAGLVQKVRLVLVLSPGENEIKYLTVVKGNYCPREFKQNSMLLKFCENDFIFNNTGKKIALDGVGGNDPHSKETKINKLIDLAERIFKGDKISYKEFCIRHCEITSKTVPSAKRDHKTMKELEIIKKQGGKWYLVESTDNSQTSINLT